MGNVGPHTLSLAYTPTPNLFSSRLVKRPKRYFIPVQAPLTPPVNLLVVVLPFRAGRIPFFPPTVKKRSPFSLAAAARFFFPFFAPRKRKMPRENLVRSSDPLKCSTAPFFRNVHSPIRIYIYMTVIYLTLKLAANHPHSAFPRLLAGYIILHSSFWNLDLHFSFPLQRKRLKEKIKGKEWRAPDWIAPVGLRTLHPTWPDQIHCFPSQ